MHQELELEISSKPEILFTTQAAIVAHQIAIVAKEMGVEVCGASMMVPANNQLQIQKTDDTVFNVKRNFNVHTVIGIVPTLQENTSITTSFESYDLEEELKRDMYDWLGEYKSLTFFNGWLHTHPGKGVIPSNIDMPTYNRFKQGNQMFNMTIINTDWVDNLKYVLTGKGTPTTDQDIFIKHHIGLNYIVPVVEMFGEELRLKYEEEGQVYEIDAGGVWNGFDTDSIQHPLFDSVAYTSHGDKLKGVHYSGFNPSEWGLSFRPIIVDLLKPISEQSADGYNFFCPLLKRIVHVPPISNLMSKIRKEVRTNRQIGFHTPKKESADRETIPKNNFSEKRKGFYDKTIDDITEFNL